MDLYSSFTPWYPIIKTKITQWQPSQQNLGHQNANEWIPFLSWHIIYIYICTLRSSSRRHHLLFNWLGSYKCLHRQSGNVHAAAQPFRSSCWKMCVKSTVWVSNVWVRSSARLLLWSWTPAQYLNGKGRGGQVWLFSPAVQHLWASWCHVPGVCRVCQVYAPLTASQQCSHNQSSHPINLLYAFYFQASFPLNSEASYSIWMKK